MNSKASFSVLAAATICLLGTTSGQSSYSVEHASNSSSSNSTSTQSTITFGSTDQPGWRDQRRDDGDQPFQPTTLSDDSSDVNSSQSTAPSPTVKVRYGEEPEYVEGTALPTNATYITEPSPSDTPTPTVSCPGPIDPATGEGFLDSDGSCAIACYNNLILNQPGDACVCPPTFQFDPDEVKCVCRSPFVLRGAKCVLLPSQAAGARHSSHKKRSLNEQVPFGVEMLHGKYPRTDVDRLNCPDREISCPLPSGGYECLDPEVTLENCGGCTSTGKGLNCRNITMHGLGEVGCNAGVCQVISCQKGFRLVDGVCIRNRRR